MPIPKKLRDSAKKACKRFKDPKKRKECEDAYIYSTERKIRKARKAKRKR